MLDEKFTIKYHEDEIQIYPAKCLNPERCECNLFVQLEPKCGYTAEQARQKVIEYYLNRAVYVKNLSTKDFLYEYGFYYD